MANNCIVCNCEIPEARVEFLLENGHELTCLKHSISRPIKAIYSGEHGTSDLIMCDRVYNDSVRTKFFNAEKVNDIDDDDDEIEDSKETKNE